MARFAENSCALHDKACAYFEWGQSGARKISREEAGTHSECGRGYCFNFEPTNLTLIDRQPLFGLACG